MSNPPEINEEWGHAACRAARDNGADQAEVWIQNERRIIISVENSRVRQCEATEDPGFCVRAIKAGAMGYARGMGLDNDAASAGARAAAMAAAAQPDPDFATLPSQQEAGAASGLFDPDLHDLTAAQALPWAGECIEAAAQQHPDTALKADITITSGACAIVNSEGVCRTDPYTYAGIEIFAIVRHGEDVGSYYDFTRARRLQDLKPHAELARSTTERAVSFMGADRVPGGDMPVLLGPLAAFSFIHAVCGAADGESVGYGRSFLAGKKNKKIAVDFLNVEENPLCAAGLYSEVFDAEGYPRSKVALIENGVLTGYLHNAASAARMGEPLTGHASRESYLSGVGIGLSNLRIRPGEKTEAELISSMDRGLYIAMGSLHPNAVSGAVSGTVDYGYLIENGRIAGPLANAMIGGDVFEMLNNIQAISSDYREEPGNIMPSLLIGSARVAGS